MSPQQAVERESGSRAAPVQAEAWGRADTLHSLLRNLVHSQNKGRTTPDEQNDFLIDRQ